jgi:hypothetical protein
MHRLTVIFSFEFRPLNSSSVAIVNNSAQLAAIIIDSEQGARWRLTHPFRVDDVEIEPVKVLKSRKGGRNAALNKLIRMD